MIENEAPFADGTVAVLVEVVMDKEIHLETKVLEGIIGEDGRL